MCLNLYYFLYRISQNPGSKHINFSLFEDNKNIFLANFSKILYKFDGFVENFIRKLFDFPKKKWKFSRSHNIRSQKSCLYRFFCSLPVLSVEKSAKIGKELQRPENLDKRMEAVKPWKFRLSTMDFRESTKNLSRKNQDFQRKSGSSFNPVKTSTFKLPFLSHIYHQCCLICVNPASL